jgi:hypothetical protein
MRGRNVFAPPTFFNQRMSIRSRSRSTVGM